MSDVACSGTAGRRSGRNQDLVLNALERAGRPMRPYELLEQLGEHGLRSPPQIYRALERLIEDGTVHKIESLNAFARCAHGECEGGAPAVFAICTGCGRASEVRDAEIVRVLRRLARGRGFRTRSATVELSGLCAACTHG